ncbi:MAG: PorT family protein [Flavobacteriales bacterium]|nr:MAG: PorT family protein [Flavobacteriales bacterium]
MNNMIRYAVYLLFLFFYSLTLAQELIPQSEDDLCYREDQFYIGVSYNVFAFTPSGMNPEGISAGFQFGFLRDFPINKRRNLAIAIGAGFSYDQFGQNLFINENEQGTTSFEILASNQDFLRNRLSLSVVEAPIEFRWRSSTPSNYKFWRVYAGFRLGYTVWNQSSLKRFDETVKIQNITELEKLRMGASLSLGYNKFNLFAYYSINPFFNEDAVTNDGQKVNFHGIKMGLIFYIF